MVSLVPAYSILDLILAVSGALIDKEQSRKRKEEQHERSGRDDKTLRGLTRGIQQVLKRHNRGKKWMTVNWGEKK